MGRFIRIALLTAGTMVFAAAPASAAPYMSWGQWTSDPGVPFSQCWDRASQALSSAGLTPHQNGRFFYGQNDVFTVSLICYDLGNNRFVVTIVVAQSGSSSYTTDQIRDQIQGVIFGGGAAQPPPPPATTAQNGGSGWDATATGFRGRNGERFTFYCPPNGSGYRVWGTDVYTDDSSVCTAAVHAGLITFGYGGTVTIQLAPGQSSYTGTERYGVTSISYGRWDYSYFFVR